MARLSRLAVIAVLSIAALAVPDVSHGANSYVVRSGDTLFGIAARLDVRLADLLRANHLTVTSVIQPGQQLTVPGGTASAPAAPSGGATYTVREGDWLFRIADRHGVTLAALLAANNLTATSLIQPGQRLTIPGATASPTPTPSTGGVTYTVKAGDWLSRIADRHGVTLAALLAANNLTATSLIQPGQRLTIPGATASPTPTPSTGGVTYTVKAGDWLSRIADRHGVTLAALLAANNLTATSLIQPGQRLTIPGATASPTPTPSSGRTYTVQQGDALSAIAARHRITLTALLGLNDLTAGSVIHPGQQLTLPRGAAVSAPSTGTGVDRVVSFALSQLGKPYKFFTAGPNTYDCSGLTLAAYAQIGVTLIHHSLSQSRQGTAVDFWTRTDSARRPDLPGHQRKPHHQPRRHGGQRHDVDSIAAPRPARPARPPATEGHHPGRSPIRPRRLTSARGRRVAPNLGDDRGDVVDLRSGVAGLAAAGRGGIDERPSDVVGPVVCAVEQLA